MKGIDQSKIANIRNLDSSVDSLENNISDLRGIVNDYTKDIENYEYNVELASEGTAESVQKMVDNVGKTYEKNGETVKATYKEQIQAQQHYLQQAKAANEEAIANNDETEWKKTQTTIKGCNARLEAIFQELTSQTSLIGENSEDVINGWRELATNSYDMYSEKVKELPFLTRMKIQEITGVVVDGTPEFVSVMETLSNGGVDALDKDDEFKAKALESLNGYLSGLTDEEKRKLIKEAGIKDVEQVMKGLKKGDLSEEKGVEILKGLYNGLENKQLQNNLIGSASSLAGRLSRMLTIKPSITASIAGISSIRTLIPGHKDGLDYVPYDNYVARLHKGERVLTAEENKAYMADNIGNKISNRNITVQFFPQTMSETELKRAETYIAKKWGMAL